MALSQSAVSELLDAFRTGEGVDLVREAVGSAADPSKRLTEAKSTWALPTLMPQVR